MTMMRSAAAERERNARGSAADRRARRAWILRTFGNGIVAPCVHCGDLVSDASLEVDRIVPGGSYRRGNVQPACKPCNLSRSNKTDWNGIVTTAAAALAVAI
jgi:5-methylcytosine-specific restriction endonuclease McrA